MHRHLLVSDTRHFRVEDEINPSMDRARRPDPAAAHAEHDVVFTANAALVRGGRAGGVRCTALTLDAPAPGPGTGAAA